MVCAGCDLFSLVLTSLWCFLREEGERPASGSPDGPKWTGVLLTEAGLPRRVQGNHEARVPLSSVPILQAQMVHVDSHFCTCLWCTSSNTPEFQSRASSLWPYTCHVLPSHLVFWSFLWCISKSSSRFLHFSFSLNSLHQLYQFETLPQSFSLCMWVWSGAQLNNPNNWELFRPCEGL